MIAELEGEVKRIGVTDIVLDVGGVGYGVSVRMPHTFILGEKTRVFTYLAVRETALDLYGFLTEEELAIFKLLLKVPKVGPKSAMQILAQADIDLLKKAVSSDDPSYLSKMSGIGKKSAEKIVVGLKDAFEQSDFESESSEHTESDSDVIDTLLTLGYSQKDARDALKKIPPELTETNSRVKAALKHLGS